MELHFDIKKLVEKHKEILQVISKNDIKTSKLVGGCVRDFLQFGIFADDIDISTTFLPDEVIELLKNYKKVNKNNEIVILDKDNKYGTIVVLIDNVRYEITTTRADIACFGRDAEVTFCENFEEDSKRRDFTINALYVGLDGKFCDFHNGINDLNNGLIRFIGNADKRIKEDYLRIVRFFRFSAKFNNFNFNKEIIKTLQDNKQCLHQLSRERIRSEIWKMLNYKTWFDGLKSIEKCGLIDDIFCLTKYNTTITNDNFFEVFNEKYNTKKYMEVIKLFYFFGYNFDILTEFEEKLKLQNDEKKFVVFLKKCLFLLKENTLTIELKTIIFHDKMKNNNYILSILPLLNQEKQRSIVDFAEEIKPLPISANELIKLGYNGAKLGEKLVELTQKWIESDFQASKTKLLAK